MMPLMFRRVNFEVTGSFGDEFSYIYWRKGVKQFIPLSSTILFTSSHRIVENSKMQTEAASLQESVGDLNLTSTPIIKVNFK